MTELVPKTRLLRERAARKEAEKLLEQKSQELFDKNQQLSALSGNLELLILERTQQLEKARDQALQANQVKSAFIANMSHEIRTPLTAVIGFAQNIQNGLIPAEDIAAAIETIISNGKHLLALLNEILDASKLDSQQLILEPRRFALGALINEVESIFEPLCKDKGLHLEISKADNLPADIVSDETRIRQVLMNLMGNALKFTDSGHIYLSINYSEQDSRISFTLRDTGIGMNQAQLDNLFVAFSQADSSINRRYGGTGLGLAIAKQLAKLLGGDIAATSYPGQGSEFVFSFACEEVYEQSKFDPGNPETFTVQTLQGNVLLVEDNPTNQTLVSQHLSHLGVEHHIEPNGETGFQAALAGDYDLILMDIQMPLMDGKEATQILRQVGFNRPIYALTANVMPEDITEYRRLGFNGHIAKPISAAEFYQVLSQHLSTKRETTVASLDQVVIDKAFDSFLGQIPQYIEQLSMAAEERDHLTLEKILHQLKGTCGNFGLGDLSSMTELACQRQQQDPEAAFALLGELIQSLQQVLTDNQHETKH